MNYLVSLAMVIRLTESLPNLHLIFFFLLLLEHIKLTQRIRSMSNEYNHRDIVLTNTSCDPQKPVMIPRS